MNVLVEPNRRSLWAERRCSQAEDGSRFRILSDGPVYAAFGYEGRR